MKKMIGILCCLGLILSGCGSAQTTQTNKNQQAATQTQTKKQQDKQQAKKTKKKPEHKNQKQAKPTKPKKKKPTTLKGNTVGNKIDGQGVASVLEAFQDFKNKTYTVGPFKYTILEAQLVKFRPTKNATQKQLQAYNQIFFHKNPATQVVLVLKIQNTTDKNYQINPDATSAGIVTNDGVQSFQSNLALSNLDGTYYAHASKKGYVAFVVDEPWNKVKSVTYHSPDIYDSQGLGIGYHKVSFPVEIQK